MTVASVVVRLKMLAKSKFCCGGLGFASVEGSNGGLEVAVGNRFALMRFELVCL